MYRPSDRMYAQLNSQSIDVRTKYVYIFIVYRFPWLVCSVTCVASDAVTAVVVVVEDVAVAVATATVAVIVTDGCLCISARVLVVLVRLRLSVYGHIHIVNKNRPTYFRRCQKVVFHDCFPNSRWHRSLQTRTRTHAHRVVDTIFQRFFFLQFRKIFECNVLIWIIWNFYCFRFRKTISFHAHATRKANAGEEDEQISHWNVFHIKLCVCVLWIYCRYLFWLTDRFAKLKRLLWNAQIVENRTKWM